VTRLSLAQKNRGGQVYSVATFATVSPDMAIPSKPCVKSYIGMFRQYHAHVRNFTVPNSRAAYYAGSSCGIMTAT